MSLIVLKVILFLYFFVLLPIYILSERKFGIISSVKQKLSLSITFCIVGLICTTIQDFSVYALLIFAGLICSLAGDYYLIFIETDMNKFISGVLCFAATHIFYISAMSRFMPFTPWEFIITAILFITFIYIIKIKVKMKTNLGKSEIFLMSYSLLLIFMTSKALLMLAHSPLPIASQILFSFGAVLFLTSDIFLIIDNFISKKPILRYLCCLTYFAGQIMIASSLFYI